MQLYFLIGTILPVQIELCIGKYIVRIEEHTIYTTIRKFTSPILNMLNASNGRQITGADGCPN